MGIWDAFSEIVEAVTPWGVVEAEAPAEEPQVAPEAQVEEKKEEPKEEEPAAEEEPEEEEEEEEEEEDEDEIKDPKEELEQECKNSPQCSPAKHHFDECVERSLRHRMRRPEAVVQAEINAIASHEIGPPNEMN
ncbi:hypothetical protein V8C26DRAFT_97092 [Trichoderma gracile]